MPQLRESHFKWVVSSNSTILSFGFLKVGKFSISSLSMSPPGRGIASYETLAQGFLILLCLAVCPTVCIPLHFQSLSDNVAAEASVNKLFTTSTPLCYFVEHLAYILVSERMSCDVSHIPGPLNVDADLLSRWNFISDLPIKFAPAHRRRMSLSSFFRSHTAPRLYPDGFPLRWTLKSN